jgi:hypothetical protein
VIYGNGGSRGPPFFIFPHIVILGAAKQSPAIQQARLLVKRASPGRGVAGSSGFVFGEPEDDDPHEEMPEVASKKYNDINISLYDG